MKNQRVYISPFLLLFVIGFYSFYPQKNESQNLTESIKIVLREVGNQLLLKNGDSTSLILPIKKISENKFDISFEKELEIEPENLVIILKTNLVKIPSLKNYRVEVVQCIDKEIAYSYEVNELSEKTIIPCIGRILPKKCYRIQILFLNEVYPIKNNALFYITIIILITVLIFIFFRNKNEKPIEKNDILKTTLGSFIFYPEQNKLIQKTREISLSKKECELLIIFTKNANKVVKRDELTKKVWEDKGVIVGRSLDTYISKLRKKLQEDKAIKIINIHGVGYKLEIKAK